MELVVKDQRKFQELEFMLKYDGVGVGEGYVLKTNSHQLSVGK